jgi:hypothetical protein
MANLRRLAKDVESGKNGCMAVYVDDDNPAMMAVQAKRAGRGARRQMVEPLPGEVFGYVPAETVIRAARAYLAEHPEAGTL